MRVSNRVQVMRVGSRVQVRSLLCQSGLCMLKSVVTERGVHRPDSHHCWNVAAYAKYCNQDLGFNEEHLTRVVFPVVITARFKTTKEGVGICGWSVFF